ncbi:MAG: SusC/RagA family TonB-linked outer membrane protein [Acidobacteria bacterium]|nr:SusC/RagA family TonB-linked outer membrane protein [Acidobacteriota bacterium]
MKVDRMLGLAIALAVALTPGSMLGQATGTVTGVVRSQQAARPVENARVVVVGTSIVVPAGNDGRYTLRGVPAGTATVRVTAIGFGAQERTVSVSAGGTATANFDLSVSAVQLTEVVTTATGQERKREVANDIAQVDASAIVTKGSIATIDQLLTARAPGVQVQPGTLTGTQGRVRIRGRNSLSLSNDPIYIIDGIRMESSTGSSSIGVGGALPSRGNDLDPDQIEKIEIVKGPSAATLYGTDAANGVIVITTKRGRAGAPRWNIYYESGRIKDRNDYPVAYSLFGRTPPTTPGGAFGAARQCRVVELANATCMQDSLLSFNLFEDPETTPLGTGERGQYGVQVSGGAEAIRYFISGEWEKEIGVYDVPRFDVARLDSTLGGIRFEQRRPNAMQRGNFRANLNVALGDRGDIAVSTNYITGDQRLPQTDNNTTGLLSSAYGGPGFKNNGNTSLGFPLMGYRAFTPGDVFQETVTQQIDRFIGGLSPTWRPTTWLNARGNFGIDFTSRVDADLCRRANCSDFGTSREGFKVNNRTRFVQYTADASATANIRPRDWLSSKTTVGFQYFRNNFERNGASGTNLPPGATVVDAGAVRNADESTSYSVTAGSFIEETLGLRDRLFLTAAVRADNHTAFGRDFDRVFYPKVGFSWVVSEESFFPSTRFIDQLTLRSAYGASGVAAGSNTALAFFVGSRTNFNDTPVPAVLFSAVGNPNLKPERATELEGGFDLVAFGSRMTLGFSGYRKRTRDALIQRLLPGSAGVAASRFENIGAVRNVGFETSLDLQLIKNERLGFDLFFGHSINDNEILDLGGVPPIVTALFRQIEGFPIFGYWQRPLTSFSDANNDGLITVSEITVGDSAVFRGRSLPHYEISFGPGLDLFGERFRVTANFDRKGGYKLYNNTERIRCQSRNNCSGDRNPSASLFEQARVVALRDHPSRTLDGFIEDADFTRWRELAVTYNVPTGLLGRSRVGAERASITFAARNLALWTKYTGIDPESAYFEGGGAGNEVAQDFQTAPPPTYYTIRFNFGF